MFEINILIHQSINNIHKPLELLWVCKDMFYLSYAN